MILSSNSSGLSKRRAVSRSVLRRLAALSLVLLLVVAHAESLGLSLLLSHIFLQLLSAEILDRDVLLLLLCLMVVQVLLSERR